MRRCRMDGWMDWFHLRQRCSVLFCSVLLCSVQVMNWWMTEPCLLYLTNQPTFRLTRWTCVGGRCCTVLCGPFIHRASPQQASKQPELWGETQDSGVNKHFHLLILTQSPGMEKKTHLLGYFVNYFVNFFGVKIIPKIYIYIYTIYFFWI
jgi:hypothetical protein